MKAHYTLFLLALSLGMTSCLDGFNQTNPNRVNTGVEVSWTDLEQSQNGVTALYNALYNDYLLSIEQMALCTDMGYPGFGRNGNPENNKLATFYHHTYSNSVVEVANKWSALYTGIFRANQLIESLEYMSEHGQAENDTWISQMAQARFFRGLFHFYLHATFNQGQVIVYDFVPRSAGEGDFHQSVSPAEEVLAFFRSDLMYAYEHLPKTLAVKDGRVTRWAAATNLGMSHLYEGEYDQAQTFFKEIIDCGVYELEQDLNLMFTTEGELNDESIFEICYQLGVRPELGYSDQSAPTNELGFTSTTNSFTLPAWITDLYQTEQMNMNDARNTVSYEDKDGVIKTRVRTMPLRGSAMIATPQDDESSYYMTFPTSIKVPAGVRSTVGFYRKYSNWDIIDDEKNLPDGNRKSGKNITVNRLADVYLMYAECMIEQGNVSEALHYMNLIRQRWGLLLLGTPELNPTFPQDASNYDGVSYDASSLLVQLQEVDRPLELSVEGHASRFIDLRRWGKDYAKRRFEKLAQQTFYMVDRRVNNGTKPRWKSWLKSSLEEGQSGDILENDYDLAAQNYNPALHSYWPIPLTEEQNNPNLYKNVTNETID